MRRAVIKSCEKLWMSQQEAIKYLGMSRYWLEDRRNDGTLHYAKVGNTVFYIKSEIDRVIADGAIIGKQFFKREIRKEAARLQ